MNLLASDHFNLLYRIYTSRAFGGPVWSGDTWCFANNNCKVIVWKPHDQSYLVSLHFPITIPQETLIKSLFPKTEKLPEHVRVLELPIEASDISSTEWVVKAFDTKSCYVFLKCISNLLTNTASKEIAPLLNDMALRYHGR